MTVLERLIADLEETQEKISGMIDRAGSLATYEEDSPWPANGCPWGEELVDGALASANLNAALQILRNGQAAMQRRKEAEDNELHALND